MRYDESVSIASEIKRFKQNILVFKILNLFTDKRTIERRSCLGNTLFTTNSGRSSE